MPDNSPSAANELRVRARFFRLGCLANLILAALLVTILVGVFPLIARTLGLSTPATDEAAIRAVLDAQAAAWNTGDIDGFMNGYWHDEGLTFISGGDLKQGWDATRKRFIDKYRPSSEKVNMGTLSFGELNVESLSPNAALVRGRYQLDKDGKSAWGRFTLLFRKLPEGWRIVHDHTSMPEKPEKAPSAADLLQEQKRKAYLGCKTLDYAIRVFQLHPANPTYDLPDKLSDLVQSPFGASSFLLNGLDDLKDPWGKIYQIELKERADKEKYLVVKTTAPDGTPISQFGIGKENLYPK